MAEAVTKVPRHSTGALVRSPSQSHFAGMVLSEFRRLEQIFAIAALMVYTQNPALMMWRTTKMNRSYSLLALGFFVLAPVRAQDSVIAPADNLIVDGVPKMLTSLAEAYSPLLTASSTAAAISGARTTSIFSAFDIVQPHATAAVSSNTSAYLSKS